jgi:hypothetical protein
MRVDQNEIFPYRVKDDFLTNPERSFYHVLELYLGSKAIICPKVGLKDFLFISKGAGNKYMHYFGRIAKKHIDFLICEAGTMRPICAIELDDSSHLNFKTQSRDDFVAKVYNDAGFPLIRFPTRNSYSINDIDAALSVYVSHTVQTAFIQPDINSTTAPAHYCPKCGIPMVLRKAAHGAKTGNEFYGCVNFPRCREVIAKTE